MTRKFTILIIGLVALLALGAVVSYAQDGNDPPCNYEQFFSGMMGGRGGMMQGRGGMMFGGFEDMGRFGPGAGMMGGWQGPADLAPDGETLTLDEAVEVAEAYIAEWDSEQALELGEVMQFDNHFYAVAEGPAAMTLMERSFMLHVI